MRLSTPVAALVLMSTLLFAAGAAADDPPFVSWTDALASMPNSAEHPSDPGICPDGDDACVHGVIDEMTARFDAHAGECHFNAVFALTYLRTTEEYHRFWHEDRFADQAWLNHYDAVFGDFYFRAYDDWYGDARDRTPPAWAIAFDAADRKLVTGSGNILLGINGHINRDLPFTLYAIGLVAPDGSSRKADHDRVNEFLNRVSDDLYPELAARFDPTIDDGGIDGTDVDDLTTFQSIPAMRELAWRNAERLANASNEHERQLVAMQIEAAAAETANAIVESTSYRPWSEFSSADRDGYCAANG